jgi:Arc/MetJ-type ribon-helix-helix transcriptional regulator
MNDAGDRSDHRQVRTALHERIDALFDSVNGPIGIEGAALDLCAQLLKLAQDYIDLQIGRQFSAQAVKEPSEALFLARALRQRVKAARHEVDGETSATTAKEGLIGASIMVAQLAAFGDDPYLYHLQAALEQYRHGQIHPWLQPRRAVAHPPAASYAVLMLRSVAFTTIEYLVASGAYRTKSEAQRDVLSLLGIAEETLSDWRKQQNRQRRGDFGIQLAAARLVGKDVGDRRRKWRGQPWVERYAAYHDGLNGRPAVQRAAAALASLTARRAK